jgi:hypothetical protein
LQRTKHIQCNAGVTLPRRLNIQLLGLYCK